MAIIAIYCIPQLIQQGECNILIQYNRMDGKVKSTNKYHSEIFKEIINVIKANSKINNVILAGDINQDIVTDKVQQFFT